MEIYIIRHGETYWNTLKKFQGSTDIELNENGRALARITGEALKNISFDRVCVSPLKRARETAEIILSGRDEEITVEPGLREMSFGIYEGQLLSETPGLQMFFTDPAKYKAPVGGEEMEEVLARAAGFMKDIVETQPADVQRILIVAHGAIISALKCYMKGLGVSDFWNAGLSKNCGVTIIEYADGRYKTIEECKTFY